MKADVVVIGGGPNGLAAAALLAKGGLKPVVLERRDVVGGAAVTEEFHPGFRASTVAHTAGPLRPKLVAALELQRHGLEWTLPEPRVFAPHPDGRGLSLFGDPARTASEIARFSAKDAARYPAFHASLGRLSAVLGRLLELTPPDVERPDLRDLFPLAGFGWALRRLGREDGQDLLRWGPMAVADYAQEWFETPLLAAVIAARGIQGMMAGPWSAGTTANLLLQAAAGDGNGAGSTVLVKGGLGALTGRSRARRAASAPSSARESRSSGCSSATARWRASSSRAARRSRRGPWPRLSIRSGHCCSCWTPWRSTPRTCSASATSARPGWRRS